MSKLTTSESASKIQLQNKDNEISSIRQRLLIQDEELQRLRVNEQEMEGQLIQLKENLNTMTQENQAVHVELRRVIEERDSLRSHLEECEQNAIKYEEMLAAKVRRLYYIYMYDKHLRHSIM